MATDSVKSPGIQEQRQLAAMKEKLAGLDEKQKQVDAMNHEEYPDHDIPAARERTKALRSELAKEIKRLSK